MNPKRGVGKLLARPPVRSTGTIVAYVFPTPVRATGTGFVIGVGRAGSVLAPVLAGYLLQRGQDSGAVLADTLAHVGLVMSIGSLVGAFVLVFLKLGANKPSVYAEKNSAMSPLKT